MHYLWLFAADLNQMQTQFSGEQCLSVPDFKKNIRNAFQMVILVSLILLESTCQNPSLPIHSLSLYGNASLGYYYAKIFVGLPPQEQTVIIDTGSGQLALPCNKCQGGNCSATHINRYFNMEKSKTSEYVTCDEKRYFPKNCGRCKTESTTEACKFRIAYAEGSSIEGIVIKDSIQFESFSLGEGIVTAFGCTTKQTNLFLKQEANGILGLSPKRNYDLIDDLYKNHHVFSGEEFEFSLCLAPTGGVLNLGQVNNSLHLSDKSIKTTYSDMRGLYSLNGVKDIIVGSDEYIRRDGEGLGTYGVFIDSGSTFTYFPKANFLKLKNKLLKECHNNKERCELAQGQSALCFHLKGAEDLFETIAEVFPSIFISISGEVLQWTPERYFLLRDLFLREICLGIESLDRFLLGANFMVNKDIVYNQKDKTVEIFLDALCSQQSELSKRAERRMNLYYERAHGHKPLSYQSADSKISQEWGYTIVGVLFIIIGISGLIVVALSRRKKPSEVVRTGTNENINLPHDEQGIEEELSSRGVHSSQIDSDDKTEDET